MYKSFEELEKVCKTCEKCDLCKTRHNVVFGVGNKNIYIANIVKCRPPQNRDPFQEEQDSCIDWLRNQVALIRPKIIVCLGRIAAMKIIKPDMKITKEHGIFFEKNGVIMMATLHPAALLRNPANKPEAFNDFLKLREKIKEVCEYTY